MTNRETGTEKYTTRAEKTPNTKQRERERERERESEFMLFLFFVALLPTANSGRATCIFRKGDASPRHPELCVFFPCPLPIHSFCVYLAHSLTSIPPRLLLL
eukprot:TRINITY_DN10095_c0_g1_i1.p3 TRINITY_DN10095_c0_g1~~TRINITY_DN10095_c0_g1_i1.p3  ORF type:complete len:102 (+),score=8.81 TRINITY_DN10095_c0_g1_i1:204-509(+)